MQARFKFIPIISMALAMLATPALPDLEAREPSQTLEDLANLQTKVSEVSRKALPATVALLSNDTGASGSGVVVTADGLIYTAAHVVQGAKQVQVVFPDGKTARGKVLGANLSKDIAMVQITAPGPWAHVDIGTSRQLEAGDWVISLGHSAGFDPARTPPVRFGRVVSKGPGNFLTTDCTLIGGDSGGPLFDLEGRVVGIHSSIGLSLENNNHAGIDGFAVDRDRLLAGNTWGRLTMDPLENPERPVLGVVTSEGRSRNGTAVVEVVPGSPAGAAGIRVGDIIGEIDGNRVRSLTDLHRTLAKRMAGDTVEVVIRRDGERRVFPVQLIAANALYR
jgi:serine protease Do